MNSIRRWTGYVCLAIAPACGGSPLDAPDGRFTSASQAQAITCQPCLGLPPGVVCQCATAGSGSNNGCTGTPPAVIYTTSLAANGSIANVDLHLKAPSPNGGCGAYVCAEQQLQSGGPAYHDPEVAANGDWEWSAGSFAAGGVNAASMSATIECVPMPGNWEMTLTQAYAPSGSGLVPVLITGSESNTASFVLGRSGEFSAAGANAGIVDHGSMYAQANSPEGSIAAWVQIITLHAQQGLQPTPTAILNATRANQLLYNGTPILAGFRYIEANDESISYAQGNPWLGAEITPNETTQAYAVLP